MSLLRSCKIGLIWHFCSLSSNPCIRFQFSCKTLKIDSLLKFLDISNLVFINFLLSFMGSVMGFLRSREMGLVQYFC